MIIDASVAFKVLIEEAGTDAAKALIAGNECAAPHLILSEVGNAIWKAVGRGELKPENVGGGLSTIPQLINIIDETMVMPRAAALAIELRHPIYDCVYLALAEGQGVRLITVDRKFLKVLAGGPYEQIAEELLT